MLLKISKVCRQFQFFLLFLFDNEIFNQFSVDTPDFGNLNMEIIIIDLIDYSLTFLFLLYSLEIFKLNSNLKIYFASFKLEFPKTSRQSF